MSDITHPERSRIDGATGERDAQALAVPINTLEPTPERARKRPRVDKAPEIETSPLERSTKAGDVPAAIQARYFSEASRSAGAIAFFEGPGAKRAAFHDHGARLSTHQSHPAVTRDLALIAAHRGWTSVRVRGEDEFRRQIWLEARALGLEVKGYTPRERDQQELAKRLAAERAKTEARETRRAPLEAGASRRERAAEGVILEIGQAPYRRREGEPLTPFVRLDRGEDRRPLEVWGAGLPQALARADATKGDRIVVRRDGVEMVGRARVSPTRGPTRPAPLERTDPRDTGHAERFRRATAPQAARDPELQGAQSHLAVLDVLIDRLVRDPQRRLRLHAEAREIVADELAQGRRFAPARVRDVEPVLAKDVMEATRRDRQPDRGRAR